MDNTNGIITATGSSPTSKASNVLFTSGARSVTGGTLQTDTLGTMTIEGITITNAQVTGNFSASSESSILQDDTLLGFANTTSISITSTITNNANWTFSSLRIRNAAILTGTGSILLSGGQINTFNNTNSTLTIGPGQTIKGAGEVNNVFTTSGVAILNAGNIAADSGLLGVNLLLPSTNTGTLAATNNGTLQLSGSPGVSLDNTNGTINANGGNISLSNLSLTGGQLLSSPNNTISFAGNITLNGTITANATLLANTTLTFTSASSLNLLHGALILQITDPSTLPTIQSEIAAGTLFTSTPNLSLALIDNSSLTTPFTTFAGQPVSPNSLLITPTLPGDANLDGHVDLTDLSTILNNFGQSAPKWTSGNFDNQPTIDLTDLSDVLNNFGQSNPIPTTSQLPMTNDHLPTPTPEPTTLTLLLPAALLLGTRRRNPLTAAPASAAHTDQ